MGVQSQLREALRKSVLYRPYVALKFRLRPSARSEYFSGFYRDNIWSDDESRSGTGSNLGATKRLREELPALLGKLQATTMLDIPCGDFVWMREVDLGAIRYIGGDVVPEMVEKLRAEYTSPRRDFQLLDITSSPLPTVDVVFCRDLFIHLPDALVRQAVKNLRRSGSTYLVTTTFPDRHENVDIRMGDFRHVNMQDPPFNFPEPLDLLMEYYEGDAVGLVPGKQLGVWRIADLP